VAVNPLVGQPLKSWALMGHGSVFSSVSHLPAAAHSLGRRTVARRILRGGDLDKHALVSRGGDETDAVWNSQDTTPEGSGSGEAWGVLI